MKTVTMYVLDCLRCGKTWRSTNRRPARCGKCKNPYWDRPRRRKSK